MAVGDQISRDGQYEFRAATGGHSVLFNGDSLPMAKMMKLDGLFGLPDQRKTDYERQAQDGMIPGTTFYGARFLTGDFTLLAKSEYQMMQHIMDVTEALQADDQDGMLVFQKARLGKRVIYCRPERLAIPSTGEVVSGQPIARGSIQWVAHDPRIYSFYEHSVTIEVGPGDTSSQETVYMAGNWRRGVPCTIVINGPAELPRISNNADGNRSIKIADDLSSSDVLVLHTGRLTANDFPSGDSATNKLADDSQWWELQKGANVIGVNREGTSGTMTVTITWRDAYVL